MNGGTLNLGGNLTGAGGVTIGAGGTLTNTTGSVTGPVAVSGFLAPGATAAGTLGTGNLSFGAGGSLVASLNGAGTAGTDYDQVAVTGTTTLTNGGLRILVGASPTLSVGNTFTILANDGAEAITGQFTAGTTVAAFDNPLYKFSVNYAGGDGNDIVVALTTILPPRFLDVVGGVVTYLTGTGTDSTGLGLDQRRHYTLTDAARSST